MTEEYIYEASVHQLLNNDYTTLECKKVSSTKTNKHIPNMY